MKKKVGIFLGSKSDLEVMASCTQALQELGIPYALHICSAHRAPDRLCELIRELEDGGAAVFIAAAGAAAHLPGVVASRTVKPVLGVPLAATPLNGQDALYAIVQMPGGIPVACLAIGEAGAKNAALLAAQILSTADEGLAKKLAEQRQKMAEKVLADDRSLPR